jgi:hypothetical protein
MNGKRLLECLAAAALAGLLLTLPFLVEKRPTAGGRGLTGGWLVLAVTGMALMLYCVGFLPEPFRKNSRAALAAAAAHLSRRPVATLALVAALAVCASTYPVVFLGSSFVSPGYGGVNLLYDGFPTLPGATDVSLQRGAGADTSVILWQDIPYAKIASVSLRTGVLPLWNRFNSAGVPLLGQGQSMVGSPLHLPVIVAGGGAMVWDAVFLGAKFLLALGFGLVVWELTRHLPSAALTAFASAFIGFFVYRVNHPAIFSLCAAPWMLYGWTRIAGSRSLRSILAWTGLLLLASWAELTSGTVKETLALLLCTNLAGVLLLACSPRPRTFRLQAFGVALAAGVAFALLAAPLWMTFWETLRQSYNSYDNVAVHQAPPALLIGFFDELFYRPLSPMHTVFCPAVNFLFLMGGLCFVAAPGHRTHNRPLLALAVAALVPFVLAFGLVPACWIRAVPLLRNIGHINNTFSCVLILLFIPVAGAGFHAAWLRLGKAGGRGDAARVLSLLGVLLCLFLAGMLWPKLLLSLPPGTGLFVDSFVFGSLVALGLAAVVLLGTFLQILRTGHTTVVTGFLCAACVTAMLWRQGMHSGFEGNAYVLCGAPRADLFAPSPAVGAVQADRASPFRVAGFVANMVAGWTGVYGLEGISGPDALMNRHYRELLDACGVERLWDWSRVVRVETLCALRPVFDFLNVRYYFASASDRVPSEAGLAPVIQADLRVLRSDTAWPRAFFTNRVLHYASAPELAALIRGNTGHPFAAVQDGDPGALPASPEAGAGPVVIPAEDYQLDPNSTSFSIRTTGPGMIVLQECWMRDGFQATLDNGHAVCMRVNHAFKGICVESPGLHRVRFSYRPRQFTLALWLHGAGLFLVAAGLVWRWRLPAE